MAEVLGALNVASIAISMTLQLSQVYSGLNTSTYQPPRKILSELPVLVSLLEEIQKNTTTSESEPTRSVSVALEISVERFEELMECLEKMGLNPKTGIALAGRRHKMQRFAQAIRLMNTESLQDATKRFRSALTLLRDIAMDHRTHDLIARQREYLCFEFESIRQALRTPTMNFQNEEFPLDNIPESATEPEIDVPLEKQLGFSLGQGTSLFSVTFSVELPDGERPFFYPARAKFDTGSIDCLIAEALVKKHKLEKWLKNNEEERTYIGLGNVQVVSNFHLQLNWSANNERTLRTNVFYMVVDSPFELILGEDFRKANAKLLPALPIRLLHKKSKAQKQAELEREKEDNRRATELTAERRRTEAARQVAQINHDQLFQPPNQQPQAQQPQPKQPQPKQPQPKKPQPKQSQPKQPQPKQPQPEQPQPKQPQPEKPQPEQPQPEKPQVLPPQAEVATVFA